MVLEWAASHRQELLANWALFNAEQPPNRINPLDQERFMLPRVTEVRHVKDFELELKFSDGTVAKLDFQRRIKGRGGVFKALESVEVFSQVRVDSEAGTLVWPNDVDFCPDVLYAEATGKPRIDLSEAAAAGS
jgi:hypothetical protein